jgi:hypothetical protein
MVVQELGHLFAQAFILLAGVAERDSGLEQRLLDLARKTAPDSDYRRAQRFDDALIIAACCHGPTSIA